ncbi:hypothetical protein G6L97_04230 [Agrobacterium tumefaciens]|uniref:hypothetical protein n=1 Tax=Agrobacterium tumefaciens TaxID=358 RepID=UPI0015718A60|nr:hypothetical protein [Agrobacterium tumefaciens]NSZ83618.1 hypothetical protein [Agrobacterium tumefaciens]WCA69827.1 hypothetical protein G6L97_04230 [Agrobacterium tumefaciens]
MKPQDIAKILNYRGPEFYRYVKDCLKDHGHGLHDSKLQDFMKFPHKVELTEDQLVFLGDAIHQRFTKVESYNAITGEPTGFTMVRMKDNGTQVIAAPARPPTLASGALDAMQRTYVPGAGNTIGKTTAAKPMVTTTEEELRHAERKAAVLAEQKAAANAKKAPVQSLLGAGWGKLVASA